MSQQELISLPTIGILAGGLGSRLGSLTQTIPKPLIEVAGEPFLIHQLRSLSNAGAEHVVLCVGHFGHLIERRIGQRFGPVRISYSYDSPSLDGTLGALKRALPLLGDRFLVLYGDTYLDIDYGDVVRDWYESGAPATMTVLRNENRWEPSNALLVDQSVIRYDKFHHDAAMAWIDYGLGGLSTAAIQAAPQEISDLSELYSLLASRRMLRGYLAVNPFHDIGTPKALETTDAFLRQQQSSSS